MENRLRGQGFQRNGGRGRGPGYRGRHHQDGNRGQQKWPGSRLQENWREEANNNYHNDQPRRDRHESSIPERTMGLSYVQKLLNTEDLQEVIHKLSNDTNGFTKLLDSKEMNNDLLILLVKLLKKIAGSSFHDVKIMILSTALNSRFMEKLIVYFTSIICQTSQDKGQDKYFWADPDDFWSNLLSISKEVQELIPTNCDIIRKLLTTMNAVFPPIEAAHSIQISDEIKAQTRSLLDLVEQTVQTFAVKSQARERNADMEPPDNFRDIKIIPSVEEIITDVSPFLRPNIVDRPYKSINQYLDIQFRLLREDFIAPLRRGINGFLRNQTKPKKFWEKLDGIKVYWPVRFLNMETVYDGNGYRVQFDFTKKKQSFNYENSKRFMFGSLVCFTCDNFKSLLFGKIVQRDIKMLNEGSIVVGFQEEVAINYQMDYLMVESSVYFEPYYHVLGVLKRMDTETFPMERYIIKVETKSHPPEYLLKDEPVFYEIEGTRFLSLNIPEQEKFYNLNESQLGAFRAALTEEFCIIQGPPGTGKTFLGLKIAHTLLNNRHAWYNQTPMLVICYTNHALDQFLEGIIPLTDNILRIGGQSKNENLKIHNLASKRRHLTDPEGVVYQKHCDITCYTSQIKIINETLNQINMNKSLISFDNLKKVIGDGEDTWFARAKLIDIKRWLLEGKSLKISRGRNPEGQAQEGVQNMEVDDADAVDPNLLEAKDIYLCREYRPLISLQQLEAQLDYLKRRLEELTGSEKTTRICRQKIELEIKETETDFTYISIQLAKFADRRNRRKPILDKEKRSDMPHDDRWQLYLYWTDQYAIQLRRSYAYYQQKFREVYREYNDLRDIEDTQLMKQHLVVGITTTGAARLQSSLQALKSPIVIVEEAAEVLEAHIVASLTKHCQHLILIGDHLQLKPGAADYQIETKFKLGISLFERMVYNNIRCNTLNVQHRMRPEISKLIKPHIYENLEDHETTMLRAPILGMKKCIYFIDHREREDRCQDESSKNTHECKFLIALARHLILNGYKPEQITILAAYLGQFFEMKSEKKKPNNSVILQDVRIAVLDNYQGEESDIILLSLVRSNDEDKAGFLKLQNRVCVALSRAKNGFYIIGNMSLLLRSPSENQIWKKVNAVLEEQEAIGGYLTLICQNHPYRLTRVSKAQDFVKLGEGGCDLMCQAQLECGHICKRLCHVHDRDHEVYKCIEKCTRLLCNDPNHMCKKLFHEECGPCTYLVPRHLDCNHDVNIECHIDPSKYNCMVLVQTKLPCDHEVQKPCSVNPQTFQCPIPCKTKVKPCGHPCYSQCHIRLDPDHLQCSENCAKPRVGCRQIVKHICQKLCSEECESCTIFERKLRSCGHMYLIYCKEDVEKLFCRHPCQKVLPCGHPCKNKCSKSCGPCNRDCTRTLLCGHKCTLPCKMECICREIIDCNLDAPCGHTVTRIQCSLRDTVDAKQLLKYCTEPCQTELKCKHKCSGTCSECKQRRIHKTCKEKCGVPLVCNHKCPLPCRKICKPCTQPCDMKCSHRQCMEECGEPCTPCMSPCNRNCIHVICTKRCGDICNVPPCIEKCPKPLKCGHPCVGFCGDPCPPKCRICDKEELTENFFGTEDDEDARFVLLLDCNHILEHSGLEHWLNSDDNLIQFKTCPKCKTNITTTERYSDYVKRAIQDVVSAKVEYFSKRTENDAEQTELENEFANLEQLCKDKLPLAYDRLDRALCTLKYRLSLDRTYRIETKTKTKLNAIKSTIQTLFYIFNCFRDMDVPYTSNDPTILHVRKLLLVLESIIYLDDQRIEDLELEINRLNRMVLFDKIKHSDQFKMTETIAPVKTAVDNIQEVLFNEERYTDVLDNTIKTNLSELITHVDCAVKISDQERMDIVKALGFQKGLWYKCPNGHPYAIGKCGGAMKVARCFCGEAIGGTRQSFTD